MKLNKLIQVSVSLFMLIGFICGCASVGKQFTYNGSSSLQLGKTSLADCEKIYGKPNAEQTIDNADGKFDIVRYLYAHANLSSAQSRVLILEFRDGVLNSYDYLSSFDEDRTVVNTDQQNQIKSGTSTKSDVVRIMGQPHGMAQCPSQNADFKDKCAKGTQVWVWNGMNKLSTLGHTFSGDQIEMQSIFVVFNKDGIVTDVEVSQTKNR